MASAAKSKKEKVEEPVEDVDVEDEDDDEEDDDEEEPSAEDLEEAKKKEIDDVRNPDVVTKYKLAAEIAQNALNLTIKDCKAGAKIIDLCKNSDKFITDATAKVYNKGKVVKGIGFPTCISVNNVVSSFSPLNNDVTEIANGDVVKIAIGVQIDGFVSQVAHTIVVGDDVVTGRKADVVVGAYTALDAAIRMLKPGAKNSEFTEMFDRVGKQFECNPIQGVYSHQVKRFEIDAEKKIEMKKPEVPLAAEQRTKDATVEVNEAWAIDVVMSTGAGKPVEIGEKTTVYKRAPDQTYQLKMKASRAVLSEIDSKFPVFPFTLRALDGEEAKVKLGISESVKHGLVEPYPVLAEKNGEIVAHFQFTALVMPNGTMKITGLPLNMAKFKPDHQITDDQIKAVLAQPISAKKSGKKKKNAAKKKKKKTAAAPAAAPAGGAAPAAPGGPK